MDTTNFTTAVVMEDKLVISSWNKGKIAHVVVTADSGNPSLDDITDALHNNRERVHLLAAKDTLTKMLERIEIEILNNQ